MTRTLSAALALAVFTLPLDLEAEELAGAPEAAAVLDAGSAEGSAAPAPPELRNAPDYEEEYEEWFEEPYELCDGEDGAELDSAP